MSDAYEKAHSAPSGARGPARPATDHPQTSHPPQTDGNAYYLRFPHLSGDHLCFAAEDDLWMAPLDAPGRAWRLTVDRTKVGHPASPRR